MDKIEYKVDLLHRRGSMKFVSIVVGKQRIESIPVPDSVRYGFAPITRWLDTEEGQEAIRLRIQRGY